MTDLPDFPWPFPWPDHEPNPTPVKAWAQYEDGSLGAVTVTGGELPALARPGRYIPHDEYQLLIAEMTATRNARLEAMGEEEAARQTREYNDLTKAGITEETARRLSGYTGPGAA
ncbi:hypothetical protein ACFC09_15645 [Streptomyces sp. NPDC056161]|uniref:hypothetical protein n=1 Tax=Streptomyces sp. NPDC056161 TaxID=3345732 RepID=UPI0035D79DB0